MSLRKANNFNFLLYKRSNKKKNMISYLGWSCQFHTFLTWRSTKSFMRPQGWWIIFSLTDIFLQIKSYRYFAGKCSDEILPLFLPVQATKIHHGRYRGWTHHHSLPVYTSYSSLRSTVIYPTYLQDLHFLLFRPYKRHI